MPCKEQSCVWLRRADGCLACVVHRGHAYTGADGSTTIAVGTDVSADGLYAGHACVWNPAGVAQFWGGANLPDAAAGGALALC